MMDIRFWAHVMFGRGHFLEFAVGAGLLQPLHLAGAGSILATGSALLPVRLTAAGLLVAVLWQCASHTQSYIHIYVQ